MWEIYYSNDFSMDKSLHYYFTSKLIFLESLHKYFVSIFRKWELKEQCHDTSVCIWECYQGQQPEFTLIYEDGFVLKHII